jgi:polysaccharide biosynthesis protein PslG
MRRVGATAAAVCIAAGVILSNTATADAGARPSTPQPPFTPNFFGISTGADLTEATPTVFDHEMNLMKQIGVHWVRAIIPWGQVEHDYAGEGNWTLIDRLVNMVEAEGMQLDAIIDLPPQWAYQSPPATDCATPPPFDINAYANFAAEIASRYGSARVSAIELENAPNLPGPWPHANPCAYTRLMQASYTAIKAVDPNITVLTAGLGSQKNQQGVQAGDVFLSNMYLYGAHGSFDALSWHPYSYPCFPSSTCTMQRPWYRTPYVRQLMINTGDGNKQIWTTEYGAPTNGIAGDGHVDENNQAAMMVNAMKLWVTNSFAGPFFAYEMRDNGVDPLKKSCWFGLMSHSSAHQKISYWAYQYEATGHTTFSLPQNVIDGTPGP